MNNNKTIDEVCSNIVSVAATASFIAMASVVAVKCVGIILSEIKK